VFRQSSRRQSDDGQKQHFAKLKELGLDRRVASTNAVSIRQKLARRLRRNTCPLWRRYRSIIASRRDDECTTPDAGRSQFKSKFMPPTRRSSENAADDSVPPGEVPTREAKRVATEAKANNEF